MKFSVAIILVALLCAIAIFSSGCHTQPGTIVGVADTNAERQNRIKDVRSTEWREFVDDWDVFWLQDRDARLSEYPIR